MSVTTVPRKILWTDTFVPQSSVIDQVYYDADNREMWVETHSGDKYGYTGVPRYAYEDFSNADSAGVYWNKNIKSWYGSIRGDVTFEQKKSYSTITIAAKPARTFIVRAEVSATVEVEISANDVESAVAAFNERLKAAGIEQENSKIKEVAQRFDS